MSRVIDNFKNKISDYNKDYVFSQEEVLNILERYEIKYSTVRAIPLEKELIDDFKNRISGYDKDYKFSQEEVLNILARYEIKYEIQMASPDKDKHVRGEVELVIKMPEQIYEHYKKVWQKRRGSIPESCIAFGTPLPKEHGKLIDADSLIKAIEEKSKRLNNADTINGLCGAVALIFDEPTIIAGTKINVDEQ